MISLSESIQKHPLLNSKTEKINLVNYAWSDSPDLRSVESAKPKGDDSILEIRKLVKRLTEFWEVRRVKAIATRFPDIHWVDFQMELQEENADLSDEIWDKTQDLVIDCEWKLRDNSTEKWYFRPLVVESFYSRKNQVIVDSNDKQHRLASGLKILSSNPPKLIRL
jgi:hypothetical protein